jgi:hypothetical protein
MMFMLKPILLNHVHCIIKIFFLKIFFRGWPPKSFKTRSQTLAGSSVDFKVKAFNPFQHLPKLANAILDQYLAIVERAFTVKRGSKHQK